MRWPVPADYQQAIQHPRYCFADPELQAGQPLLTPLGLPRVASGKFASVYPIRNGKRTWAVRCFTCPVTDHEHRYRHISQHLQQVHLPSLVESIYQPQGICLSGQWYPIVKMEWVEGDPLHVFIERNLRKKKVLKDLAKQWRELVTDLRKARMAHGDLQHGNVLVSGGQLRIVDYDGMFVPALRGEKSCDRGHPNYQHPSRRAEDYGENLDNFAALVIYLSLLGLAADPDLWRFATGENLVLCAEDYTDPDHSPVLQQLKRSRDPQVTELAGCLIQCCKQSISQVPSLEQILPQPGPTPQPSPRTAEPWWESWRPPHPPSPRPQPERWWESWLSSPSSPSTQKVPSLFANTRRGVRSTSLRQTTVVTVLTSAATVFILWFLVQYWNRHDMQVVQLRTAVAEETKETAPSLERLRPDKQPDPRRVAQRAALAKEVEVLTMKLEQLRQAKDRLPPAVRAPFEVRIQLIQQRLDAVKERVETLPRAEGMN